MIHTGSEIETVKIPIKDLSVGEHLPQNIAVIHGFVKLLTDNKTHDLEPIIVKPEKNRYMITNGHHRFTSYVIAGRKFIPVLVVREKVQ